MLKSLYDTDGSYLYGYNKLNDKQLGQFLQAWAHFILRCHNIIWSLLLVWDQVSTAKHLWQCIKAHSLTIPLAS